MSDWHFYAGIWFVAINATAFVAFGFDKWQAARARWRISEYLLVTFGALGGWLAGLFAMSLFHHKTSKTSFQFKYALALIPFAAEMWAWLHWR